MRIEIRPANRWQAFKERRFPRWLLRLFPVRTKEVAVATLEDWQAALDRVYTSMGVADLATKPRAR